MAPKAIDAAVIESATTITDARKARLRNNFGLPDQTRVERNTAAGEDYTLTLDCASSYASPTGPSGDWTLIFEDNFDGTSLGRAWLPYRGTSYRPDERPYNSSSEAQAYKASRVTVTGGNLVLSAVREATTANDGWGNTTARTYSSGMAQTCGRFSIAGDDRAAFVEARMMVPTDPGYWPAFWLTDPLQSNEAAEIDVAEFFPINGVMTPHTFVHWGDYALPDPIGQAGGPWSNAIPANGTWHTYGAKIERTATGGRVTSYYDGAVAKTIDDWNIPDQPLALVVNLAVHSGATPPNAAVQVDYIRAWKA